MPFYVHEPDIIFDYYHRISLQLLIFHPRGAVYNPERLFLQPGSKLHEYRQY
jgi:hypothetical protein